LEEKIRKKNKIIFYNINIILYIYNNIDGKIWKRNFI